MEHVWDMWGAYLKHVGACLGDDWELFEECLRHVWEMFGSCWGDVKDEKNEGQKGKQAKTYIKNK